MDAESMVESTRARLRKFEGKYREISQENGISYSWLTKFAHGQAPNPRMNSLQALQTALDKMESLQ